MNPSTADLLAAIESLAVGRGDRAPEQLEHRPRRRARGGARGQAGRGRRRRLDPRRSRGDDRLRRLPDGGRERRRDAGRRRVGRDRRGDDRVARRPDERNRRSARARGSGSPAASRSPAGTRFEDVAFAVAERLLAEPRDLLTILSGADAPPLERAARARRRRLSRSRRGRAGGRPAALPPASLRRVGCRNCGRGRAGPCPPRRGQPGLSRGAGAAVLAARRHRGGRVGRRRHRRPRPRASSTSPTSC